MARSKFLRILIVIGLLAMARLTMPLVFGWAHFENTPSFREWTSQHPVDESVWRAVVPEGSPLGDGLPWRSSPGEDGGRFGQWLPLFELRHGEELIAELAFDISVELREITDWATRGTRSEAFEAVRASLVRQTLDPDFHAVAVLTVQPVREDDDGVPHVPRMQLDVFVLAGPGGLQWKGQMAEGGLPSRGERLLGDGPADFTAEEIGWRAVLGFVHSVDEPPPEGLAYHARAALMPDWTSVGNGHSGAGISPWEISVTTEQYSFDMRCEQGTSAPWTDPDVVTMSTSVSLEKTYRWNGEVW